MTLFLLPWLPFVLILVPFWWHFAIFLGVRGSSENHCFTIVKPYFLRFWDVLVRHFLAIFFGYGSRVILFEHFTVFVLFRSPLGPQMGPFGTPRPPKSYPKTIQNSLKIHSCPPRGAEGGLGVGTPLKNDSMFIKKLHNFGINSDKRVSETRKQCTA